MCRPTPGTDRDPGGGALTILEPLAAGWRGLLEVFREFAHDDCVPLAGSIAFFTLFSFPPILAMVVELAGLVVAPEVARAEILESVELFAGRNAAEQTHAVLQAVGSLDIPSGPMRLFSVFMLLFAATMVLAQAQQALNRVWGVKHARGGLKHFLLRRIVALLMIAGLVLLLLASMLTSTVVTLVRQRITELLPEQNLGLLLTIASAGVSYLVVAGVIALLFKWLPEARVPSSDALLGALITALLLGFGREVIAWVLGRLSLGSAFGAAQSLAILLFWVFYSSAIVLWGAELTKVIARHRGHRVRPDAGAVPVEPPGAC